MAIAFINGKPTDEEVELIHFGTASDYFPNCASFLVPLRFMMEIMPRDLRIWHNKTFWQYHTWRTHAVQGKVIMRSLPCKNDELHKLLKMAALLQGVELG